MPILCQFVSTKHRGTAYGIMNMTGVFAGAAVTELLGKWSDGGNLGQALCHAECHRTDSIGCSALFLATENR